jgi:hypothetical protein
MWKRWLHGNLLGTNAVCAGRTWLIVLTAVLLSATAAAYAQPARTRAVCDDGEGPTGTQRPEGRAGLDERPCAPAAAEQGEETPDSGPHEQAPTPGPSGQNQKDGTRANSVSPPSDKKGSWLFAPIPINSPAIGAGLQWAVARVFPLNKKDEISPPSTVGIGGVFTNNGSRAVAIGARLYLKEDKYRLTTAFGNANVNLDIYGVGQSAGDNGTFVPLKTQGKGFLGEALVALKKGLYVGMRGQYRNLRLSLNQERLGSSDVTHEPPEKVAAVIDQIGDQLLGQQTVSLGPRFQWDSRDSVFYPKQGVFMDVNMDFFGTGLGSKWNYEYYKVGFNKYIQVARTQVIAFRAMTCAATGERVPIYDLCLFGAANDIRGYSAGRYQDRRMFATQGEYRFMLPSNGFLGRFGVVAFGGFGGVARKYSDIGSDLLAAGGAGARFRLLKKQPINFRVDYGIGKVGHTLSIGILEAF